MKRFFPILEWLPQYQRSWLRSDIVAGLAVWAVMVPQAMAYAGIVGVPPLVGLYTVPLPMIAYAIFGTSRAMVIGPDSATALIAGVTVASLATEGTSHYLALTSALALAVGVFFLIFGLLRMGWVANFIPEPAMYRFIQGLVWVTIIGQVPKLFGIEGVGGDFFEKLWGVVQNLPDAHAMTTVVGLSSVALLFALKTFLPRVPSALAAVVLAVLAVTIFDLEDRGVWVIGSIDQGLPPFGLPDVSFADLSAIVPGALAIVLLGYAQSLGAAKAATAKLGGKTDANQELVSFGPANIGAALNSGFVVCGSLSKTSVSMASGAKSQLANVVCAVLALLTLMFLMPLFQNLPVATLGAIVIQAIFGLANASYLTRLFRINRVEFAVAMTALVGVLTLSVLHGIGLGVVLALILLIRRSSAPGSSELGQLSGQDEFRDLSTHPEAKTFPGLLIFRLEASLIFINANYFADQVHQRIDASTEPVREVLVDCHPMSLLDTTGANVLIELAEELHQQGVRLSLGRTRDSVRERLRLFGVEEALGEEQIYDTLTDARVKAFEEREAQPA